VSDMPVRIWAIEGYSEWGDGCWDGDRDTFVGGKDFYDGDLVRELIRLTDPHRPLGHPQDIAEAIAALEDTE